MTYPSEMESGHHVEGDDGCQSCWQTPERCHCGGIIHNEDTTNDEDEYIYLIFQCDECEDWYIA